MSSRWSLSKSDAAQKGGVVGHADERILIHDAYGDPLASAEEAHPSRVAGIELALAGFDAAGAAEEWVGVDHHLVAGDVSEVKVVHLEVHKTKFIKDCEGYAEQRHMILKGLFTFKPAGI